MPLTLFHPIVQSWFRDHVGRPTDAQGQAWPAISSGRHVLVVAPTGSGKTLAAFLWALDGLLTGRIPGGACRILYVSPLRALNNDVQRNLLAPLASLRDAFALAGQAAADVRVMTRSGDTPADERQRMARRPPEILITTPESLNILLTSPRGRAALSGIRTVVLDEVHAVIGSKRGVHLVTAIDRLVPLCGEVQRVALSATVHPVERVAVWVGGYENLGDGPEGPYRPREVAVVRSAVAKHYAVRVAFPAAKASSSFGDEADTVWPHVTSEIVGALERNRSTLVFANSKRMVEKLTRFVNDTGSDRVHAHHGALSRETRAVVEQRLKDGSTRGIIATNSLELGIDIGTLDEVLLVQTPPSVASAVQRIGRAGHGVGDVSRATFLPLIGRDVLDAAVMARAVIDGAIEPVQPIQGALDVLAQIILSMTSAEPWTPDALHAFLRTSAPYHALSRCQLDRVLDMLTGRYAHARVRELRPLLSHDRVTGTLRARRGSDLLVYMSGGTIPDRGYFRLRHAESMALLGELDEEFVWERSVGDTFTLGVQSWRVERITHNDVLVRPVKRGAAMAPFWRGESRDRSFHLSRAIGTFLERADGHLEDPAFLRELRALHHLDDDGIAALVRLLTQQRRAMAGMLPHRHRVIVEHAIDPSAQGARGMVILHTFWGGAVHRPLTMALQAAWERERGVCPDATHDDACIVIDTTELVRAEEIFALVSPETVEDLLRSRLERTGFFGARFREAAGRALLLPRAGFRHRNPLWLSRAKGKKLLAAVSAFEDFPLVVEAWRECLQDAFDLPALRSVLEEVRGGEVELHTITTSAPSPFARSVTWQQTNQLMYQDDTPETAGTRLRGSVIQEILHTSHLRPRVPADLAARLQRKLQRTEAGWSPRTESDLLDWVVERLVLPEEEWESLCEAVVRDHAISLDDLVTGLGNKVVRVRVGANPSFVTAAEAIPRWRFATKDQPLTITQVVDQRKPCAPAKVPRQAAAGKDADPSLSDLLADLLRFHGPVSLDYVVAPLGLSPDDVRDAVDALVETQKVVVDRITDDAADEQVCDAENLERLLRMMRTGARPSFEAQPVERIPGFLASWQRVGTGKRGVEGLQEALDRLLGLPLAPELWETEVLPSRVDGYYTAWLDALFAETPVAWLGFSDRKVAFVLAPDRELFAHDAGPTAKERAGLDALFPHPSGRFTLDQLQFHTKESTLELTHKLWSFAWKGRVTTDGFLTVRRGADTKFGQGAGSEEGAAPPVGSRRSKLGRWAAKQPSSGSWYRWPDLSPPSNALEQDEVDRDRVRVLLDRWGVLFRQLLEREPGPLRWNKVFRTLRVMELSGEVVSGQFFEGVEGAQFASPAALQTLRHPTDAERCVWMSAADPASACGLGISGLGELPRRVAGNHLALQGDRVVVVSEGRGKRLTIHLQPDDPALQSCLGFLSNLVGRQVQPVRCVTVETINGGAAWQSAYRPVLERMFHAVRDRGMIKLMRRY